MEFSKIHVFPYSIRNGTAASLMPQVDENVKKQRVQVLLSLSEELEKKYYQSFLNQTLSVLIEEYEEGYTTGFTSNYIKVYLKGEYPLNQMISCFIYEIRKDGVIATTKACFHEEIKL